MKKIKLTQRKYALVDDEDFETLNQFKWCYNNGYAIRRINQKKGQKPEWIHMHRAINETPDGMMTDHINRNRSDNRRCNLRTCTRSQNGMNSRLNKNNKSGFRGVSWDNTNKKWQVSIRINGNKKPLGKFLNRELAVMAYNKKAKELFGEFAGVNQ